jgi:hypothetical protein
MIEIEAAYSDANLCAAISRLDDDGGASQTPKQRRWSKNKHTG